MKGTTRFNENQRLKSDTHLTRRNFMKQFSIAGLGLSSFALTGCDSLDILSPPSKPIETEDETLALIIGSGFGGAVTALRLGEAGIPTLVLEQGKRYESRLAPFSPPLPPDGRSTWLRTETILPFGPDLPIEKYVGVLDRVEYPDMHVYRGIAVGGGSIVYGGISVEPPEDLFYEVFPRGISYTELQPYYERVRQMLRITTVPPDIEAQPYYDYVRVFAEHAAAAGLEATSTGQATDWDVIRSEIAGTVPPSAIRGEAFYGNNSGCKNSLDQNYLPMAEATGYVKIYPLHRVTDITEEKSGKYTVAVEQIDETGQVIQTKKITTTFLFFAAGSVGTTDLLVKAREKGSLPNLNKAVGTGWGTNGNIMFTRVVDALTGKMQGGPVIKRILDSQNRATPAGIESIFFPIGSECGCLLHLMLALDTERGHFIYNAATDRAELVWSAGGNAQVVNAAIDFAERMNTANSGHLGSPAGVPFAPPELLKDFTYHPLGGMVIGEACDMYGRVQAYQKMYVMDGSLLPGSCATANPSLTIAALAERNIQHLLTRDLASYI